MVSKCPLPLNHELIRKRRQEFYRSKRYHDNPINVKHTNFKPGAISQNLKDAMGLGDNRLPRYIYSMRRQGYPPGYLRAAVESSPAMRIYHGGDAGGILSELVNCLSFIVVQSCQVRLLGLFSGIDSFNHTTVTETHELKPYYEDL